MKLQHLAIVFVIIILPISMVISQYIQTQIDTISLQTQYNNKLQTATHDAIKAFQLNTLNNKYSTLSDSKIRDIEASISTFYNSLGTELGASGYDQESLQQFIPAIVYTMYDGYYIYGKYQNEKEGKYQYGLKPYIYYSCRYVKNNDDFVVNYTLDNSITVFGKINDTYVTKSGTLINPDTVQINGDTVIYNDIRVKKAVQIYTIKLLDFWSCYHIYSSAKSTSNYSYLKVRNPKWKKLQVLPLTILNFSLVSMFPARIRLETV